MTSTDRKRQVVLAVTKVEACRPLLETAAQAAVARQGPVFRLMRDILSTRGLCDLWNWSLTHSLGLDSRDSRLDMCKSAEGYWPCCIHAGSASFGLYS